MRMNNKIMLRMGNRGCAHGSMLCNAGFGDRFWRSGLDYTVLPLLMAFAAMVGFALVCQRSASVSEGSDL